MGETEEAPEDIVPPLERPPEMASQAGRSPRFARAEAPFVVLALAILSAGVIWFIAYLRSTHGAERVSALFAAGLVSAGALLLLWSYIRRPGPDEDEDFLDKLLAATGQALLLGALLSFGFGVVGQRLDDERAQRERGRELERAATELRRDNASQVRRDAGGKAFPAVDLRDQVLAGLNLTGFDFRGADLSGANLSNSSLKDANLAEANLSGVDLTAANLTGAELYRADLTDARLILTDLSDSQMTETVLSGADLTSAVLINADLSGADLSEVLLVDDPPLHVLLAGACFDDSTRWPTNFPEPEPRGCCGRFGCD